MKIICVGRNYAAHVKELNNAVPTEPVLFMKSRNALLLPDKPFYYPEFSDKVQYECEVVVKICRNGKVISRRHAHSYFREIGVGIDFTARDLQENLKQKGLPWEIAKSFDGAAAIGEFIPVDSNMNVDALPFELKVNGEMVQQGNTADMIFDIAAIIEYASRYFTLNIGDYIFTGTPAGVGDVNVYDHLVASLGGRELLDVSVR